MLRIRQRTIDDQRGGIFLSGLVMVTIMTLLGIALFDLSRIEGMLATGDAMGQQTLYCAEAGLSRTMNDFTVGGRIELIEGDIRSGPNSTRSWNGEAYPTPLG